MIAQKIEHAKKHIFLSKEMLLPHPSLRETEMRWEMIESELWLSFSFSLYLIRHAVLFHPNLNIKQIYSKYQNEEKQFLRWKRNQSSRWKYRIKTKIWYEFDSFYLQTRWRHLQRFLTRNLCHNMINYSCLWCNRNSMTPL